MKKVKSNPFKKSSKILTLALVFVGLVSSCSLIYYMKEKGREIEWVQQNSSENTSAQTKIMLERNLAKKAERAAQAQREREEAERLAHEQAQTKQSQQTSIKCRPVTNSDSITVVINKKNCFSPIDWAPSDLVDVGGGHFLRSAAAQAYQNMRASAQKDGIDFWPSSAYRSYRAQQNIYQHWVRINGSAAIADTVSARAGFSEHQTGLVADFQVSGCALECFDNKAAYHWLTKNAHNFGFIQRYQTNTSHITGYNVESWHWRFVGVEVAQDMKAKNISTLEEYFNIQGGDYLK